MFRRNSLIVASLALGLVATSIHAGSGLAPMPSLPETAKAVDAAKDFSMQLREALMAAMAQGGPTAGIRVCRDHAPRIADAVSAKHGVALGRIGVRTRQPTNRIDGWQRQVLDAWAAQPADTAPSQWAPQVHHDADTNTLRWAKAIETEGTCLACHGSNISDSTRAALDEFYPDDRATGFLLGSLRGLIWVEVPSAAKAPGG